MKFLRREFFERDPVTCAREVIGARLVWDDCEGIVVEAEAYAAEGDEACHTFLRPSARRFVDEHEAGAAYVYLNYGMYWLTNALVKGGECDGFVLLRALQPERGLKKMRLRRNKTAVRELCSGPGKLSMAMGIDARARGRSLVGRGRCGLSASQSAIAIEAGPRIGISKAKSLPWRFMMKGNPYVSRAR